MGTQPHMYEVNYLAGKSCDIKQVSKKTLQLSIRVASEEECDHHVNGVSTWQSKICWKKKEDRQAEMETKRMGVHPAVLIMDEKQQLEAVITPH